MSKETFYFSHDYNARNDIKIKKLIVKHGYEGYGLYWAIIEDLYQNQNSLPLEYECIAYDLRVSNDIIESIVKDFDLFKISEKTFGSSSVERRLKKRAELSKKRSKAGKISAAKRKKAKEKDVEHVQKGVEHVQNDVQQNPTKESKVKERKVKDSKVKENSSYVDTYVSMSKATPSTHHEIDYEAIINFFNDETQGVFGRVMYPISKNRQNSIRARIKDFGLDGFAEMVKKATNSNFLKGDNKGGFVAKFDWMIRPNNFQKIIEGNYDNKQQKRFSIGNEADDEELMFHIQQGIARGLRENKAAK